MSTSRASGQFKQGVRMSSSRRGGGECRGVWVEVAGFREAGEGWASRERWRTLGNSRAGRGLRTRRESAVGRDVMDVREGRKGRIRLGCDGRNSAANWFRRRDRELKYRGSSGRG